MDRFDPTAGLTDFDAVPGLRDAWSRFISDTFDEMNYGDPQGSISALKELQRWGFSDADLRFFNPLSMPIPSDAADANVTWRALPTSFDAMYPRKAERFAFLDAQHPDPRLRKQTRVQDEYNEWVVVRDRNNKITNVIFTSEPAAYYDFLANDPYGVGKNLTQQLLVQLYRTICNDPSIQLSDLLAPDGSYDWWNQRNARFAVHMQQINNTLEAEINIAARAALVRKNTQTGEIKTDAEDLINCGKYGDGDRQSDPAIGAAVNGAVRDNRFITLQNPVGLYMTGLDTTGWRAPDGADPQSFWRVIRGTPAADPAQARIVRAEYAVTDGHAYTVSDITIGGEPIQFGAQIAANIGMRLGVTVSPVSNLPTPRPIGCLNERPPALPLVAHAVVGRRVRA